MLPTGLSLLTPASPHTPWQAIRIRWASVLDNGDGSATQVQRRLRQLIQYNYAVKACRAHRKLVSDRARELHAVVARKGIGRVIFCLDGMQPLVVRRTPVGLLPVRLEIVCRSKGVMTLSHNPHLATAKACPSRTALAEVRPRLGHRAAKGARPLRDNSNMTSWSAMVVFGPQPAPKVTCHRALRHAGVTLVRREPGSAC